jgi:hypothetical protein
MIKEHLLTHGHWYLIGSYVLHKLIKGKSKMEKDIALGSAGKVSLSFSGGKAVVSAAASEDGGAVVINASVVADAGLFVDQLEAIVAKALPATAAIDPAIFAVIKSAVMSIA